MRPLPTKGYRIHTSQIDTNLPKEGRFSPPPCGEGSGVGVAQKAPLHAILHYPHLQLLPARGRREPNGQRYVNIVATKGERAHVVTDRLM